MSQCSVCRNTIDEALNFVVLSTLARPWGAVSDRSHKAVNKGYELNSGGLFWQNGTVPLLQYIVNKPSWDSQLDNHERQEFFFGESGRDGVDWRVFYGS